MRAHGILTDHRGELLRLGPAPYVTDDQLDEAVEVFREALR
jgi:kynureninase